MVALGSISSITRVDVEVGNTPTREININVGGRDVAVGLKLEGENPFGSIKDRVAVFLLDDLERRGLLKPGGIVVESTSGNLGVGLAHTCPMKKVTFVAVIDPKTTEENTEKLVRAGAEIELVREEDETGGYLLTRLRRVKELCRRYPGAAWPNQYGNPANPRAHFLTTGPELFWQMRGRVDAVFVPVSTCGTLDGVSRYFRNASPATRIVAVDAVGSVAITGTPGPRKLTGIGSSKRSEFLREESYDDVVFVDDAEAFAYCHALVNATAIKVGGSSGAALAACVKYLGRPNVNFRRVACLCPDRGDNYDSTIYNRRWLLANGFNINVPVGLRACA